MSDKKPVIVEVNGGVVTTVWNAEREWIVLDWDNLLGDGVDIAKAWEELPQSAKEVVEKEYSEEFGQIMAKLGDFNRAKEVVERVRE